MDPAPDPDPTPDPTPFFTDLKDAKKNIFSIFFSHNLPTSTSSSVYVISQALFQSAQHIYEKREGSGAGSGSVTLTNGFRSRSGRREAQNHADPPDPDPQH
jgi:hypothetical protein